MRDGAIAVSVRASAASLLLLGLAAVPVYWIFSTGGGGAVLLESAARGLVVAVDAVGWVLIPQIVLAAAILSLALQQIGARLAGAERTPAPAWLDPAVESALLLGLLGTISGMVRGFVGVEAEVLEPGPLVHALGAALRSTFVGFAIALVGVWLRDHPAPGRAEDGA
jgi:hypothetical protein